MSYLQLLFHLDNLLDISAVHMILLLHNIHYQLLYNNSCFRMLLNEQCYNILLNILLHYLLLLLHDIHMEHYLNIYFLPDIVLSARNKKMI